MRCANERGTSKGHDRRAKIGKRAQGFAGAVGATGKCMQLSRPLAAIDVETTGVNSEEDRVIEFGVTVLHPDGTRTRWSCRFNPEMPIPAESTAVHGIGDADVVGCPKFAAHAKRILAGLSGKHLAGYNLWRLDLPIIDAELRRCGMKLDLTGVLIFDAAAIFFKKEPRGLGDAVRKYCGREHEGKHGAAADAEATLDVFMGQLSAYPDLAELSIDKLAEYARLSEGKEADLAGKLMWNADGKLCFAFGKHRGKPVLEERSYAEWMIRANFPGSTCELLEAELHKDDITVSETSKIDDANVPF